LQWDKYLADDGIHTDENGAVRTKAELLREIAPLPKGLKGSIKVDSFRAAVRGDIAVIAHEDQELLDDFGQPLHTRLRSLALHLRGHVCADRGYCSDGELLGFRVDLQALEPT
jgi:hypothetical protein